MRMSTSLLACLAWCTVTMSPAPALAQYSATGGEWRSYAGDPGSTKYSPLDQVDGTLYVSTAMYQAAAIDAGSGETVWVYDPQVYLGGQPTHSYGSRGVAYWTDGQDERIFWGTSEGYLLAVDAKTGQPVLDFGNDGRVDLTEGIPRATRGDRS